MFSITKTETEVFNAQVDFILAIGVFWQPNRSYSLNDVVLPSVPTGAEYKATTAGRSGSKEPQWPSTGTKADGDGSLIWTKQDFSSSSYDNISTNNIPSVSGITLGSGTTSGTEVSFDISAGTKGKSYIVSVEATLASGEVVEEKIKVVISGD